jgi:group I intron endonuclease
MQNSGIYQIVNTVNGKRYIGSAVDLRRRWNSHRSHAARGVHHSHILQAAWNKYGPGAFSFTIIERCDRENILAREQYYINTLLPEYNIALTVTAPMSGMNHTPEAKALISKLLRGRKRTPEQCARNSEVHKGMPAWNRGRKATPEECRKNSEGQKGKKLSEEHRQKISLGGKGKKKSESWKKAIIKRQTRLIEHNGVVHTPKEWAVIFGISYPAFNTRLRQNKDDLSRVFVPVHAQPQKPWTDDRRAALSQRNMGNLWAKRK